MVIDSQGSPRTSGGVNVNVAPTEQTVFASGSLVGPGNATIYTNSTGSTVYINFASLGNHNAGGNGDFGIAVYTSGGALSKYVLLGEGGASASSVAISGIKVAVANNETVRLTGANIGYGCVGISV